MERKRPQRPPDLVLDGRQTQELLRNLVEWKSGPDTLETLRIDTEAAAQFIAEHAAMLSAVAFAAGHSTAKIICDVLYVNTVQTPKPPDPA
jgi:hypothetical protein